MEIAMFDLFGDSSKTTREVSARLRRVEQKLDMIMEHLGLTFAEEFTLAASVREAADRGAKIEAIKRYREETGAGLADAKREVENYMDRR